jgi:hypothetical protein
MNCDSALSFPGDDSPESAVPSGHGSGVRGTAALAVSCEDA